MEEEEVDSSPEIVTSREVRSVLRAPARHASVRAAIGPKHTATVVWATRRAVSFGSGSSGTIEASGSTSGAADGTVRYETLASSTPIVQSSTKQDDETAALLTNERFRGDDCLLGFCVFLTLGLLFGSLIYLAHHWAEAHVVQTFSPTLRGTTTNSTNSSITG